MDLALNNLLRLICHKPKQTHISQKFYIHTYPNTCIHTHTHIYHHVVSLSQISLTLSRHFSLSFITSTRSSGIHLVSSHSCWMYVWAGHPAFAWPYVGVHRSTYIHTHIHVHMYTFINTCMHIHKQMYIYIHIYTHIYINVYSHSLSYVFQTWCWKM